MTSALQRAADLAAAEPDEVITVCTVAGPRRPFSTQIYTGAELRPTSLRRGAYDALALPSLFMGKTHPRGSLIVHEAAAERQALPLITAATVIPQPAQPAFLHRAPMRSVATSPSPVRPAYVPRANSAVGQVVALLTETKGFIRQTEVVSRFDVPRSSLNQLFKTAIEKGAIARLYIGGAACYALPDFVPPLAEQVPPPKPTAPPKELKKLTDQLANYLSDAFVLVRYIEQTERRIAELQAEQAT